MSNKNCCWCLFQFSQGASFTDLHLPAPRISSPLQSDCCLRLFHFYKAQISQISICRCWRVDSSTVCIGFAVCAFHSENHFLVLICISFGFVSLFVSLFYLLFPISSRKKSCEHQSPQLFWFSNLCFIKFTKCCGAVTFINGPKERIRMTISVSSSLS